MGLLDDVLMRKQKPFLDIDELMKGKSEPLPDGYNFSKMNTNAPASGRNFDYSEISGGGTQPTLPSYDPTRVSSTGRIQNRLPEWQEVAEGKADSLSSPQSLGATRTTPAPFPAPSLAPAPAPAPVRPPPTLRPPMELAGNNGPPVPPTRPAEYNQTSMLPPTRPEGLGGPPLPPSRQLALGEPNLPRVPNVPPPNIPRGMLAPPPEIASTRAAADSMPPAPPVKAPMNRSLNMDEIPKGYGYWDDGTVRNAQGQSAPIYGPSRGEAASHILSNINPAAGSTSLPAIGSAAKAGNFLDAEAIKPAIKSGLLGTEGGSPVGALNSAVGATGNMASRIPDSAPPVGSAIPGQKDKDEDSAMPDTDFDKDGSSEGEGGISDSDFASGDEGGGGITDADFAGDAMGGMGGGMGGLGGILGLVGSLAGGGKKKDEGFDPPPKAPSVPPPGASTGLETQRQSQETQMGQKIMAGILSGDTTSLLQRRRPYT